MTPRRRRSNTLAALLTLAVSSFARADAQQPDVAPHEALVRYSVDPQHSTIHAITRRSGIFSFLGHDHAILARAWDARMCADARNPRQGHARIEVSTAALEIDTDSARALAGLGRGLSAEQRRKLQAKLLDEDNLDAANHPRIVLDVTSSVDGPEADVAFNGQLTIRGVTRDVVVAVNVADGAGHARFRGALNVAQSSFGIRPESIAGVIRVTDVVAIHFDLRVAPTTEPCTIDTPVQTAPSGRM